jgi:cysteine desulfurase
MIYLDNNATTPMDHAVADKMSWFLKEHFGNPSSLYPIGRAARELVSNARKIIADALGADRSEIYFTGSGTESDNWAVRGIMRSRPDRAEFITSAIEHPAVLETAAYLESQGKTVHYIPVDPQGRIQLDFLEKTISSRTALVSVMLTNNELGTIQPIAEVVKRARAHGALVHTDAVQAFGKIPMNVDQLGIDLLTVSAHKVYGPKGIGALYVRKGVDIKPLIYGGHQEKRLRPGTENTAGIIGFGEAVRLMLERFEKDNTRIKKLAEHLKTGIQEKVPHAVFNGPEHDRVPSTLNFSFFGLEAEALLLALATKDIYVSTGSACSEDSEEVSHVLSAIGLAPEMARSTLRISLGRTNTEQDIETVLKVLPEIVSRLREISALDIDD